MTGEALQTDPTLINLALFIIFSSVITFFAAELGGGLKKVWQRLWLRHSLLLFLISLLVTLFRDDCTEFFLMLSRVWLLFLRDVFPGWTESYWPGSTLLIIGLSLIPASCIAAVYYVSQKKFLPTFWSFVWPVWLMLATFWLSTFTIHLF